MKRKRPNFFYHLHQPNFHKREGSFFYSFGLGFTAAFLFAALILTGILEVFYYVPSSAEANQSLQVITYLVPYGSLIRGIHYWAGQLLLGVAILHMLRVVLTGSYKRPRRFNWLLGLVLLVLVLFANFTGYGLRWDEDVAWALLVGTNLLKTVPWVGDALFQVAVGSSTIGEQTIVRFYGWHIYGLSLIALFFVGWHIFRVRRDGGISTSPKEIPFPKIPRDEVIQKEVIGMFVISILLVALALLFPPGLSAAADFNNIPEDATAPWFFIWIQLLLRNGNALLMGVIVPSVVLLLLGLVPYLLDRSGSEEGTGIWFNKKGRIAQITVLVIILGITTLTLIRVFSQ
ncbi:MAG TPA: cytochrome b N-terminal domain-containing protein [Anaerolineales bacterium]|nr:cytochrome b N-terminal domain-containing protein [Anaerolineales bacterium]